VKNAPLRVEFLFIPLWSTYFAIENCRVSACYDRSSPDTFFAMFCFEPGADCPLILFGVDMAAGSAAHTAGKTYKYNVIPVAQQIGIIWTF
jgi:hypothetical protein